LAPKTTTRTHVGYGNDLLGIMMTANQKELDGSQRNLSMTIDELMDECKTFFFAGHETTSNLLTWAIFLLAINPEWQEVLRKEVISICDTDTPDAEMLSKMKSVCILFNIFKIIFRVLLISNTSPSFFLNVSYISLGLIRNIHQN